MQPQLTFLQSADPTVLRSMFMFRLNVYDLTVISVGLGGGVPVTAVQHL